MKLTKIDKLLAEMGFERKYSPQYTATYIRDIYDECIWITDRVFIDRVELELESYDTITKERFANNLSTEELLLFLVKQTEVREGL